ncbi:hypothetical protein AQUCO_00900305v1 [Aquilegia coerulea]|uniref:Crossover junction endonuclease MUS81 n=1 Tax=Aquilegia coerulea TaxID=218851 RepID=A0A2G5ED01_AQUCA|nr:hypothetical protein AQUCO_00900305v1 [Aquilegia coerulea]
MTSSSPRPVFCSDNEELALFMWKKKQERASDPKGFSDRIDNTLYKAYCSVCSTKTPIQTLKEFSEIKGVGKWIIRLMKDFFKKDSSDSEIEELPEKGKKKAKVSRRYVPQKNSAAYALLITLYRETANGNDFMKKQELIDAAELSGLSRVPIASELGKGRQGQFAGSAKDWYSGWTSMKTLIEKGYVAKFSNPAKYKLLEEGREAAKECLSRSGLADSNDHFDTIEKFPSIDIRKASVSEPYHTISAESTQCVNLSSQDTPLDIPIEFLEKITHMGYSMSQVRTAFAKVSQDLRSKDVSSLLPVVIHHLQKDQIDVLLSVCRKTSDKDSPPTSNTYNVTKDGKTGSFVEETGRVSSGVVQQGLDRLSSSDSGQSSFPVRACSSSDYSVHKSLNHDAVYTNRQLLMVPPLRLGEKFEDAYDVILILDDREQFVKSNKGCRSRTVIEKTRTEFKIQVEVRRLPVGDAIWIARHKQLEKEYVLDFIVERKEVDDLRSSIRDNRYRDQKLRLLRCGIQKLIYIVEGDPNASEAAESIKTACFTTEILDGFDVQRTNGLGDTLRKYGYLTLAITHHYRRLVSSDKNRNTKACPSFDDFIKECQDLEKMTVSDVFAVQLMQVPQVTEEIALAVVALYPTVVSLAHAYSLLDGDIRKQEGMLMTQNNNLISRVASKNIFKLVWDG